MIRGIIVSVKLQFQLMKMAIGNVTMINTAVTTCANHMFYHSYFLRD